MTIDLPSGQRHVDETGYLKDLADADFVTALSATIAGSGALFPTNGGRKEYDDQPSTFDLRHNSLDYLFHLTSGENTTASSYLLGLGTDHGQAGAILVSHKNPSNGAVSITSQGGAGKALAVTSEGAASPMSVDVTKGTAPVDFRYKYRQGFNDGVTTEGSTTLTSATGAFTAADVGNVVSQTTPTDESPLGCIPSGTTIVSVESATSATMSKPAESDGTEIRFRIEGASRTPDANQAIWRIVDDSTVIAKHDRTGLTLTGARADSVPLTIEGQAGSTRALAVRIGGTMMLEVIGSNGGLQGYAGGTFTNAQRTGYRAFQAQSNSNQAAARFQLGGSGSGDLIQASPDGAAITTRVSKAAQIVTKAAAPALGDLSDGEMALTVDSATGNLVVTSRIGGGLKTATVAVA